MGASWAGEDHGDFVVKKECEKALGRDSPTFLKKESPGALVKNTDSWALMPHQDFQEEKPGKLSPMPPVTLIIGWELWEA